MSLDENRSWRFRTGLVLLVAGTHFIHDIFTAFLAPLLPLLIQKLGLSLFEAGSLAVVIQLPSLLNPLLGSFIDRHRLHRLLVTLAPGMSGLLLCFMGLAPTYGILVMLLLVAGFSVAGMHVAGPVLVRQYAGNAVGRGMSFFMVGGELARTVGPLVAVQIVSLLSLEGTWRVAPVAVGASLVLWFRLRTIPVASSSERPIGLFKLWRQLRRLFTAVMGILVARAFMVGALTTFLPTFLYGEGHTLWMANISLSILELAGAAGALTSGTLSDWVGRRRILFLAVLLAPPLMVLFVFAGGIVKVLVLLGLGFLTLSTTPVLLAVTVENSGTNPAAVTGTYMMISFSVRALIVLVVGAMGDAFGLRTVYLWCAGLAVLGVPFVFLLPRSTKRV